MAFLAAPSARLPRLAAQLRREHFQINCICIAIAGTGIVRATGYVGEFHAHGRGDGLAEGDRLTIGERGQEGDGAARGRRLAGANDPFVDLVGKPHGEQRRALGKHGRVEFRGTLRDDAQRGAVLAGLLRDPSDRLPGRAEGLPAIRGNIPVRFFAKHVDFVGSRAPKRDLEREPRKHRHDRIDG